MSPGQVPLPAAWVAGGSARLDSAPLPFVQVPCPLPASRSWAPQYGGSQWSCHVEGAQTLCGCHKYPKPAVFPWGGFPPASSLRPTGNGGHDEARALLTSTLTAACFARSPHASPPLELSLLLQGSRLRAHLSLPSCSPVSWAFLGAFFPSFMSPFFSLIAPFAVSASWVSPWVMASVVGTEMQSRVLGSADWGRAGYPAATQHPAACHGASLYPRGR